MDEEYLEQRLKLLSAEYQAKKAYVSTITVAGYGAFFAIWAFIAERPPTGLMLWAALSMILSAIVFIFWTVGIMIWRARRISKEQAVLGTQDAGKLEAFDRTARSEVERWHKVWIAVIWTSLSLAAIGLALLLVKILMLLFP